MTVTQVRQRAARGEFVSLRDVARCQDHEDRERGVTTQSLVMDAYRLDEELTRVLDRRPRLSPRRLYDTAWGLLLDRLAPSQATIDALVAERSAETDDTL